MRILLVDDDVICRESLHEFLDERMGHELIQCGSASEALEAFRCSPCPMVLTDIKMPGMDGLELLRCIKSVPEGRNCDIVLVTGYGSLSSSIDALRAGAYDYILKPVNLYELRALVDRVAEHQHLLSENFELTSRFEEKLAEATRETESRLQQTQKAYASVAGIGDIGIFSDRFSALVSIAEKLHADRSVPVLIQGETGTGKEILARLVHFGKGDVLTPIISLNCSAIPQNLFESELFGYEVGAYTGANRRGSIGKLELASGGTLFLDEIGDLPAELQPKLLRVLAEREIYRLGGLKKIKLDVRIICSTNRDLESMVAEGTFRRDLYYRLNLGRIYIAPLRHRRDEIMPLARMFLERFSRQKGKSFNSFSPGAAKVLESYDWPGNVRELQNAIERVVLLGAEGKVLAGDLEFLTNGGNRDAAADRIPGKNPRSIVLEIPEGGMDLKSVEARIVSKVLQLFDGNKTLAAGYFGCSRSSLRRKLENLEI